MPEHDRAEADLRTFPAVSSLDPNAADASSRQSNVARSVARLTAVQALYQLAMSGGTTEDIISQFGAIEPNGRADDEDAPMAEADKALFAELVRGTRGNMAQVDEMVASCLDEAWPVERMEVLLRAILRCGVYEMFARPSVPVRVVISEYVRVADAFFEGKEPALVNAVLDKLARVLRPEDLAKEDGRQKGIRNAIESG